MEENVYSEGNQGGAIQGGRFLEEETGRNNPGGGIGEEKFWRGKRGEGIMETESGGRNQGGEIM